MPITIDPGITDLPEQGLSDYSGVTEFGTLPLNAFISSTVFDVDATILQSYNGGTTLFNFSDCADGSPRSAYNFAITNATYEGTPGSMGSFFALGGTSLFSIAANTVFTRDLHKTTGGSDFWFAVADRSVDGGAIRLIGTMSASNQNGFNLTQSSSERRQFIQGDGTTQVVSLSTSHPAVIAGVDYLYIGTYRASDGTFVSWLNQTTGVSETVTFNTTTTDAAVALRTFASATAGTRAYAWSMGNAFIGDGDATLLRSIYRSRHGRHYG